jgi:SAM-dependent methyltransferase
MPFKQLVRAEVAAGLDETYRFEQWADDAPGAAYYDVHVSVIEARESSVALLRAVLPAGGRILESGCGTGRWMAYFNRLGLRAVGVDDSPGPLGVARRHDPDLVLVRGDAVASPFRSASFDAVFSAYVAEHFEDGPGALLAELHRVLKPGGVLVLVVPYDSPFRRLVTHRVLQAYYWLARRRGQALAFTEYRFSRAEVRSLLEHAGFHIERLEPDDYRYPWAKGLCVDLGPLVRPRRLPPGSWELNGFGRLLARGLAALSPWAGAAGILAVARRAPPPPTR